MEIKRFLENWGCVVLGPVPSVSRTPALLDGEAPDAAVLDLNLKGEMATPVAAELERRMVRFVLVTGYGAALIREPVLHAAPRVDKPVSRRRLRAALVDALELGH